MSSLGYVIIIILAASLDVLLIGWMRRRTRHVPGQPGIWLFGAFSPALTWLRQQLVPAASAPPAEAAAPAAAQAAPAPDLASAPSRPERIVLTLILLGGAGLLAAGLQRDVLEKSPQLAWGLLILGLLLLAASTWIVDQRLHRLSRLADKACDWLGVKRWQLVCLAFSPIAASLAAMAAGDQAHMHYPGLAITFWLAGIGLAVIGSGGVSFELPRSSLLAAGLFSLLAFVIRGWNTSHIPIILSGDEASSGLSAISFLQGYTDNIFRVGWFSFPSLYYYILSRFIAVFGQSIHALRLCSALAGALTVGATYLVVYRMVNKRAALFSAIFLAAFHYHVHFSRIGLNNIWDGLWFVIVLGALWHGLQTGRRASFVTAGLALGLAQYFFVSGRALLAIVPAGLLLAALAERRLRSRQLAANALVLGLCALAIVLPLALFFSRYPNEFLAPLSRSSIWNDQWLAVRAQSTGLATWQIGLKQLELGFGGFTHVPLTFWYEPGTPLLRPLEAALFLAGIVGLLRRPRSARSILLGLWLVSFGLAGSLSDSTPAAQRYVAVAPALAIVAGYGLESITARLNALWPRCVLVLSALALLAIVGLGADDVRFYFLAYTPRSDFGVNGMVAQRLADYLQGESGDCQVLFFGQPRMGYYSISSLPYLAPHIQGVDMNHAWGSPENPLPSSTCLLFVFLPEHRQDLQMALTSYPGGHLITEAYRNQVLYWLYKVVLPSHASGQPKRWRQASCANSGAACCAPTENHTGYSID